MTKKLDPDLRCLREAVRALNRSSSRRMLKANLDYLYDRYIYHPSRELPAALAAEDAPRCRE